MNITEYLDYRKYLKDFYLQKKEANPDYSYRLFMKKGGLSSPSHLKMIMDGERNLTSNTIPKYIKALGLTNKTEIEFFENLVHYSQAKNQETKLDYFNRLLEQKRKKGLSPLELEQYDFLSTWYHVVVYVLIDLPGFKNDLDWLALKLKKKVSKRHIQNALENLKKLSLIEDDPIKGLRQTQGALSTPDADMKSQAIYEYHKSMITLANHSLDEDLVSEREFNGVTFPIDKDKLPLLKEKIREFRKEINELTSNMESAKDVYQLNIQLFPLTKDLQ
ncbi:MAG: TIGR02147 family protein [Oligoflexia bacterium]|nr:TIGR02147 family protein [Oligoflexia bacterium]